MAVRWTDGGEHRNTLQSFYGNGSGGKGGGVGGGRGQGLKEITGASAECGKDLTHI